MERKQFHLSKIKFPASGIEVSYTVNIPDGVIEYVAKTQEPVHPDLLACRRRFTAYLPEALGWLDFAEPSEIQDFIDQSKVDVKGVATQGSAVTITAAIHSPLGIYCANTPKIQSSEENNIDADFYDIETEVYLYIYEGKCAQLKIFGE